MRKTAPSLAARVGATARDRTVTVRSDVLGQVLRRDEADGDLATGDPHALWYRYDGREIGGIGNNGSDDTDYADTIETRRTAPSGAFRPGAAAYARFGQAYDMVSTTSQGSVAGRYTAQGGDTLHGVALALWGDSALWYKLAQANGLGADAVLAEGQVLRVPAGVIGAGHNAGTFAPYNPSDAFGDTSPTTPRPQAAQTAAAAKNNKCGVFGAVLIAVVAIAVTVATSGAALAAIGGTSFASGVSTVLGTAVLGGTVSSVGAGALIAGGAIGGAIGAAASQGVGIAIGAQQGFSWKGVALGALGGAAGGAIGPGGVLGRNGAFAGAGPLGGGALRGLLSNAAIQGVALATGLQTRFDWAGAAAAGIGGGIGGWAGAKLGSRAAGAAAGGLANAAARSLVTGTGFGDNILAALPDVIAQTIGGFVQDRIAGGGGRGGAPGDNIGPLVRQEDGSLLNVAALDEAGAWIAGRDPLSGVPTLAEVAAYNARAAQATVGAGVDGTGTYVADQSRNALSWGEYRAWKGTYDNALAANGQPFTNSTEVEAAFASNERILLKADRDLMAFGIDFGRRYVEIGSYVNLPLAAVQAGIDVYDGNFLGALAEITGLAKLGTAASFGKIGVGAVKGAGGLETLGPGWRVLAPAGEGAATGPLPAGYRTVSRWVGPDEAAAWMGQRGTGIPTISGSNRMYVTELGAVKPGGTGPIRVDFALPEGALQKAGKPEWFQIFQPTPSRPVYNIQIHVPEGTKVPGY